MTWGFVTCGPNEALVISGKSNDFQILGKHHIIYHSCVSFIYIMNIDRTALKLTWAT